MYRFSPMHQCIYIIPRWIANTLKRHGLSLVDLLNFDKIKPILSMNDLLNIEASQYHFEKITGIKQNSSILYEWISTANDVDKLYIEKQIDPLSKDKFQRDAVSSLLFTEVESLDELLPFEVVPLADLAIGVVVTPGAFAGIKAETHHLSVIRNTLKQLYVYEKRTPVTSSGLYSRYLELLSQES